MVKVWWRRLVYTVSKRAQVSEINVQRCMCSGCWIRIEKIGNRQFNSVVRLAIHGGSEEGKISVPFQRVSFFLVCFRSQIMDSVQSLAA